MDDILTYTSPMSEPKVKYKTKNWLRDSLLYYVV